MASMPPEPDLEEMGEGMLIPQKVRREPPFHINT